MSDQSYERLLSVLDKAEQGPLTEEKDWDRQVISATMKTRTRMRRSHLLRIATPFVTHRLPESRREILSVLASGPPKSGLPRACSNSVQFLSLLGLRFWRTMVLGKAGVRVGFRGELRQSTQRGDGIGGKPVGSTEFGPIRGRRRRMKLASVVQ